MLTAVGCEELPDSLLPTLSFASAFSSDQVDDDRAARGGVTKDGCGSRPVVVMVKEGVILAVPQPTGGKMARRISGLAGGASGGSNGDDGLQGSDEAEGQWRMATHAYCAETEDAVSASIVAAESSCEWILLVATTRSKLRAIGLKVTQVESTCKVSFTGTSRLVQVLRESDDGKGRVLVSSNSSYVSVISNHSVVIDVYSKDCRQPSFGPSLCPDCSISLPGHPAPFGCFASWCGSDATTCRLFIARKYSVLVIGQNATHQWQVVQSVDTSAKPRLLVANHASAGVTSLIFACDGELQTRNPGQPSVLTERSSICLSASQEPESSSDDVIDLTQLRSVSSRTTSLLLLPSSEGSCAGEGTDSSSCSAATAQAYTLCDSAGVLETRLMKGLPCLIPQFVCTSSNGLVACAGQASGVVVVFGIANDTETTVELPNGWSAVSGHWQHNLLVILARKRSSLPFGGEPVALRLFYYAAPQESKEGMDVGAADLSDVVLALNNLRQSVCRSIDALTTKVDAMDSRLTRLESRLNT